MIGPAGLVQGHFQLVYVHIRWKAELHGQLFSVHDPYGPAPAFPLPVQAWGVENADAGALVVKLQCCIYIQYCRSATGDNADGQTEVCRAWSAGLALDPPTGEGNGLADEEVALIAGQEQGELRVFSRGGEASQRYLTAQRVHEALVFP